MDFDLVCLKFWWIGIEVFIYRVGVIRKLWLRFQYSVLVGASQWLVTGLVCPRYSFEFGIIIIGHMTHLPTADWCSQLPHSNITHLHILWTNYMMYHWLFWYRDCIGGDIVFSPKDVNCVSYRLTNFSYMKNIELQIWISEFNLVCPKMVTWA